MDLLRPFRKKVKREERMVTGGLGFFVSNGISGFGYARTYYEGFLEIPAVDRGVSLYTETIGTCEWDAFRTRAGKRDKLDPRPLVLEQPNPEEPAVNTYSAWVLDYVMHGNAFGIYASRDAYGTPTSIVPVPAEMVWVRRITEAGEWLPVGAIEYKVGAQTYSAYEVFHVKGQCRPGEVRGLGLIEKHFRTRNIADQQTMQAGSLATSGVPTIVYQSANPNLKPTDAAYIKQQLIDTQQNRSPAVIPAADKLTPLAWNPTEMQMIEAREFTLKEWAQILGLPETFLGASKSSDTYSNIEQEALNFAKFSLNGIKQRFEGALSALLPRGTKVKADLSYLLQTDTKTMFEAYKLGVEAGLITRDEARERMGYPEWPEEENVTSE